MVAADLALHEFYLSQGFLCVTIHVQIIHKEVYFVLLHGERVSCSGETDGRRRGRRVCIFNEYILILLSISALHASLLKPDGRASRCTHSMHMHQFKLSIQRLAPIPKGQSLLDVFLQVPPTDFLLKPDGSDCHLDLSKDALDDRFLPHFGGLLRGHACILDAMNFNENRITAEGATHLLREVHESKCDRSRAAERRRRRRGRAFQRPEHTSDRSSFLCFFVLC